MQSTTTASFGVISLLVFIAVLSLTIVAVLSLVALLRRKTQASGHAFPKPIPPGPRLSSVDLIAQLTRRFCPQCRAPLAADSPHGLCPACLMAAGLESSPAVDEEGVAITTPGSQGNAGVPASAHDLQRHFPNLEILELLGQGGMGTVYKARQKHLDRLVAIKVIPPEAAQNPAFAERFAREARALARLNHPNIVTVHDFGEVSGVYYLLMEYVDGLNLRQTMRDGQLTPEEALAIVPPICDALQYAHDQNIVHRDIKPENVLLDRTGRVKIADFGLAKLLGVTAEDFVLTRTQQVMGTPRYMAPEQIERPTTVDHRADIYSLGVMIYEMLTGQLPLGRFEPPSHKVQVDVRIDEIVLRALEREPDRRYQRVSEMKTGIESVGSSPLANPPPQAIAWPPKPPKPPKPIPSSGAMPKQLISYVLFLAVCMVISLLTVAAGIGLFALAFVMAPVGSDQFWGWMGGAIGCVGGGLGSLFGTWNTYRQLEGAEDLMYSPRTTWLDTAMRVYLALGILMLAASLLLSRIGLFETRGSMLAILTIGGIIVFQGALFIMLRWLLRRALTPEELHAAAFAKSGRSPLPAADEAIRSQVRWPATALMIVGILNFLPLVAGCLLLPVALFFVPVSTHQERGIHESIGSHSTNTVHFAQRSPIRPMPAVVVGLGAMEILLLLTLGFQLPLAGVMLLGSVKMRQLKAYGLAQLGGIAALVPCGPMWIVGLPVGIWVLWTLNQPDVKRAFDRGAGAVV